MPSFVGNKNIHMKTHLDKKNECTIYIDPCMKKYVKACI